MKRNPAAAATYRTAVGVTGALVVLAGIVMIPLPGPGWLVVIAGLAILASEFAWARRLLDFTKAKVWAWSEWTMRQPFWVRTLIAVGTFCFVYAVFVVSLRLFGVPTWMPDWVPLWR
ncbi:TIGR02611 family protein [soil metagenome]